MKFEFVSKQDFNPITELAKFLIKDENVIYTKQKRNGEFKKDNIWSGAAEKLTRQILLLTDGIDP
jgi:hypothetical protein